MKGRLGVVSSTLRLQSQGQGTDAVCQSQVVARSKLTPAVLQLFLDSGHERVLQHIQQLNIQQLPHVLPLTRNRWLGENPHYY